MASIDSCYNLIATDLKVFKQRSLADAKVKKLI